MSRFVIEHLPRIAARYHATPLDGGQARAWLQQPEFISLVRTTELISAIDAGMGISLRQSDMPMTLRPGDEALLIGLSFGVLLAWAQGKIPPLEEDWRCFTLTVEGSADLVSRAVMELALVEEAPSQEASSKTT